MSLVREIDAAVVAYVGAATAGAPPKLAEATRVAVAPGGSRARAQLTKLAARACGDPHPNMSTSAAVAVELVHCASLVHDDLPCFDDATVRRGRSTVHHAFGEPIAVLVGDALIVVAFELLAECGPQASALSIALARGIGPSRGIIGGQAWESEPAVPLDEYHRLKTGALFAAAGAMGAISAGAKPGAWRDFGERVGRAYQAADDLVDAFGDARAAGKSLRRDEALERPSAVSAYGAEGAWARVEALSEEALAILDPNHRDRMSVWLDEMLGSRLLRSIAGRNRGTEHRHES